jgi:hypothetical protein
MPFPQNGSQNNVAFENDFLMNFFVCDVVDLMRYIYGPLSHNVCYFNLYVKNVSTILTIIFFNSILIFKYIFIFVLKNPLGFQDEFWTRFIYVWAITFTLLSQFVLDFIPGRALFTIGVDQ